LDGEAAGDDLLPANEQSTGESPAAAAATATSCEGKDEPV
jgi:hypothetical protein